MAGNTSIITCYFNPARYASKKFNFDLFVSRLGRHAANLVIVEMATEHGEFELGNDHKVIRVRGDSFIWQKERLHNIAIAHLPPACTKVVWLDGDLLFEETEWLDMTSAALDHFALVQPFERLVRLPQGHLEYRGFGQDGQMVVESFAAAFARDPWLAHNAPYQNHGRVGGAWAARRDLLDSCGLYDACLTGSGDHLMAHAFAGALNSPCIPAMIGSGHSYTAHFARWAAKLDQIAQGNIGYVPGLVLHLWHGAMANRRYRLLNEEFKTFDFDPDRHLRASANGPWEWADAPAAMRTWSRDLFLSRNEDGDRKPSGTESARQV
jgi:hypothetical protein